VTLIFRSEEQLEAWRETFRATPISSDGLHLLDGNILELIVTPPEQSQQVTPQNKGKIGKHALVLDANGKRKEHW